MEEPFSWSKPNPISVPTLCDFAAGLRLCPPPPWSSQQARQPGGAPCARRRRGAMASLHEYHVSMSHIVTHSWIILDDFGWFQTNWHNFFCWPLCSAHKTSNWGQIQYTLYISGPRLVFEILLRFPGDDILGTLFQRGSPQKPWSENGDCWSIKSSTLRGNFVWTKKVYEKSHFQVARHAFKDVEVTGRFYLGEVSMTNVVSMAFALAYVKVYINHPHPWSELS